MNLLLINQNMTERGEGDPPQEFTVDNCKEKITYKRKLFNEMLSNLGAAIERDIWSLPMIV